MKVVLKNARIANVREAIPEDARSVVKYLNIIGGESDNVTFGAGEFKVSVDEERQFLKRCISVINHLMLIAELDGEIIGCATLTGSERPRTRHSGTFGITVRKKFQGQGLGTAMTNAVIEYARSNGVTSKINLMVRTDNVAAISVYTKCGFTIEGEISRCLYVNGKYFDDYCMGLIL